MFKEDSISARFYSDWERYTRGKKKSEQASVLIKNIFSWGETLRDNKSEKEIQNLIHHSLRLEEISQVTNK